MGTIFEELIRKFSETSNEEAGEHFTPRDVVKLMTELLFVGEQKTSGSIKLVYDPACGTGGMLTSCKEFITKDNPDIDVVLYGQEINDEIYAICKADMLIKGENANNIKGPFLTLSNDKLKDNKFDYMISNPPYGRDWEQDKQIVDAEAEKGFDGRFRAGLPRKNDGQLLFIQHMISKMKTNGKSRIAVITNGSPLFTGDAGSGESNIRKWIFENDYLEALIALPDQLFFSTGIGTYVWILTNQKTPQRKGKVQLIDAPRLDSRKTQEWKLKTLTSLKKTIDDEDELYIEFKKYTQTNYKHEIEKAVSTLKIIIETLEKNSIPKNNQFNQDIIETILNKFHKVVIELDFKIQTENDVKKLLKALLGIHYNNIKSEEHVKSYAGVSSRIDLYIKDINYGIEIKLAKNSINHEKIVEQINDDIKKYQKLSNCEKIYFFIYNPESLITNHVSLENVLYKIFTTFALKI